MVYKFDNSESAIVTFIRLYVDMLIMSTGFHVR